MSKHSISKSTMSNISKFSVDIHYFYFIIISLIIYTSVKVSYSIVNWKSDFSYYFDQNLVIKNIENPGIFHILSLSFTCFIANLIPAIILRFCIGVILIKSQIRVQRFLSFILILIFIFTTKNDGLSFGNNSPSAEWLINLSKFINLLFLGFIIISAIILFVNINENAINRKIRITIMFFSIIGYLFYDWKKTRDFRIESTNNIKKSEIIFILNNPLSSDIEKLKKSKYFMYTKVNFKIKEDKIPLVSNSNIANYASLLSGLFPFESGIRNETPSNSYVYLLNKYIEKNKNKDKLIYISNIGSPSSIAGISNAFDGGVACDNDQKSIYRYSILVNLNPILVFLPTTFILKYIPKALCLNASSGIYHNIIADIYNGVNFPTEKEKIILSFLDNKIEGEDILKIIEKINETLESDKIKIKIIFIDSKKLIAKSLSLSKGEVNSISLTNIKQIVSNDLIANKKNENYLYQEEEKPLSKTDAEILDNRVSFSITKSSYFVGNLKRKYTCFTNDNQIDSFAFYEKISQDIPQKIFIKKNQFNNNTCEKTIEFILENDASLFLSDNTLKKLFVFYTDKL